MPKFHNKSMKSVSQKRKFNGLLQWLMVVSLGIHLLIFMHISGIYRSNALTYIEFAMQDISKPFTRNIPRPARRHKLPAIHKARKINVPAMKVNPVDVNPSEALMEDIGIPEIQENAMADISGWNGGKTENVTTANDYFQMVRLKIESHKKYPPEARSKHMRDRVRVRFVITLDGQVSSLKIVKASRYQLLNGAALNAVESAAPFPVPPGRFFSKAICVEVTILFEFI